MNGGSFYPFLVGSAVEPPRGDEAASLGIPVHVEYDRLPSAPAAIFESTCTFLLRTPTLRADVFDRGFFTMAGATAAPLRLFFG